jgi:hypothetical protein
MTGDGDVDNVEDIEAVDVTDAVRVVFGCDNVVDPNTSMHDTPPHI